MGGSRGGQRPDGRQVRRLAAPLIGALVLVLAGTACKPLPLGGVGATFGNNLNADCPQHQASTVAPCGSQPMVWAAINGPYSDKDQGDPYATKCPSGHIGTPSGDPVCDVAGGAANPDYRTSGYTYAVDVAPADIGIPITIWSYDLPEYPRTITGNNVPVPLAGDGTDCKRGLNPFDTSAYYDTSKAVPSSYWAPAFSPNNCQTGDNGLPSGTNPSGQNMDLQLWDNDGNDNTVALDSKLPCHQFLDLTAAAATYKNAWSPACTFTPTQAGIYPLQVRNSGITGVADFGNGTNSYALKLTGTSTTKLFALNEMSLYVANTGATHYFLAPIDATAKGKKLDIDLFDPGDGSGVGQYTLQILGPPGGAPNPVPTSGTIVPAPGVASSCTYNGTPSTTKAPLATTAAADCTVVTRQPGGYNVYNGRWLRIEVQLDPAYRCSTDCWWSVVQTADNASFPDDRLVVAASVN